MLHRGHGVQHARQRDTLAGRVFPHRRMDGLARVTIDAHRSAPVQVLAKAGALLDRLAEEKEATAVRLAELTGEPRSSIYRLLTSLQAIELVEPGDRRGTYRLGLKVVHLGAAVVGRFDERRAALPSMERIHAETGETVFLCVRRAYEAVCIERIDGKRVQSLALRLGGSLPLHAGAAPRILLAYEPREFWGEYVRCGLLEGLTSRTPVTREQVFARLEDVRRLGYSVSDEDVTIGIAALGAPILDYRGRVCAALSISGVRPAILQENERAMLRLVVDGAHEISRTLGHQRQREGASSG
jgi:DNA-binding IclR family transcriptional regulator